ncbi:MAG: hypothetical protein KC416_11415, partial [Myxococcales bacterium]|nr:hypothetical protein [Myxococcales bacterium]
TIDDPDYVAGMASAYTPTNAQADDYRCFIVEPDPVPPGDFYLTGYEVQPGQPSLVHHVILYGIPDDRAASVRQKAENSNGVGFPCFGGVSGGIDIPLVLWAPGLGRVDMPEGTGFKIAKDRLLVMQVHYNLASDPAPDLTRIRMTAETTVPEPAVAVPLVDTGFELPPEQAYVETSPKLDGSFVHGAIPIGGDTNVKIYGVFPHMHTLGRTLKVNYTSTAGDVCLVDVDRWDFNWQDSWWYDEPLIIGNDGVGGKVEIQCGYDTSSRKESVFWGDRTVDEMCLNYLVVTGAAAILLGG